jgi:hypothetical protein
MGKNWSGLAACCFEMPVAVGSSTGRRWKDLGSLTQAETSSGNSGYPRSSHGSVGIPSPSCTLDQRSNEIIISNNNNFMALVHERTIPTERPQLVGEVSANFCILRVLRGQRDGSLCRILGFQDRSRYFFFQVAPQLYPRGWMDPIRDPLLLRKCGSAWNRTRTSGSVARNSDR